MKTDYLLYKLFKAYPDLPFRLADWPFPAAGGYALRAEEVKETRFQLDGVLVPTADDPTLPVVFLEAQFQSDPPFYGRWFTEIFIYLYRQPIQRPWRAIAIFPDRATDKAPSPSFEVLLQLPCVRRVYLEDLADTPTTHWGLQLLQLIIAPVTDVIPRAQAVQRAFPLPPEDPQTPVFLDLLETILVYKLPQLSRQEIQAMLHLPDVDLKQTRFYQEVFAEGHQVGHQEGQEDGRQREVALLLRQLRRRLGPLAPAQETRIQALPVNELENLGEALLDFQTVADLTAWLQQH
jgi:predicted transposase/invertase (TIGR01784 family)